MFTSYVRYNHKAYGLIDVNETRAHEFQFELIVELDSRLFYELTDADIIMIYDNPRKSKDRRIIELHNVQVREAAIQDSDSCIGDVDTRILARVLHITSCMVIRIKCTGYDIKHFKNEKRKIYKKLWLR